MTDTTALPSHVRALLAPGALAPAGVPVELVQTHGSFVLLTPDRVYKLKKPRDLGFLDYSTLDRRRAACAAELTLNRRLTTGVYLRVAPVTRTGDGYALDGDGAVVDYAVVMRRLPADGMMDALIASGAITAAQVERLAAHLAGFYASAPTGGEVDAAAAPARLLDHWQENFAQTLARAGSAVLPAARFQRIVRAVYGDLLRLGPLWQERIAAGRARDGHGDLRASAVCFEGDAVQVYDCIEFDARYRHGDVAADVAFLAMDLDRLGRADLADVFVSAFIRASGDRTLGAVLPFYRCYRAYVRGKVEAMLLDEPEVDAATKRRAAASARRHFALAARYARPHRPTLALVTGPAAPTAAPALAARLGAVLISPDEWQAQARVRLSDRGHRVSVVIEDADGDAWRPLVHELSSALHADALVVDTGGTAAEVGEPIAALGPGAEALLPTLLPELYVGLDAGQ